MSKAADPNHTALLNTFNNELHLAIAALGNRVTNGQGG